MKKNSNGYKFDKAGRKVLIGLTFEETKVFEKIENRLPFDGAHVWPDGKVPLLPMEIRWGEIMGYAQAVVRTMSYLQRFDLTNSYIHDNRCSDLGEKRIAGAAFALDSIVGRIEANVIRNNSCGRGGAGFLGDEAKSAAVTIARNLVDGNAGTQGSDSHGGGFYFFGKNLTVRGNLFTKNSVTGWGAGLYIGAWPPGGNFTNATLSWNVYRDNRAGIAGGGLFCDDGASCTASHEIYDRNCGGNIYLDGGNEDNDPTISRLDHVTVVGGTRRRL